MQTAGSLALGAALLLGACGTDNSLAPFRRLDSTSARGQAPFKSALTEHAALGAMIRDAVTRGDLDSVHGSAHALVQLVVEHERPAPQTRLGEMVNAARNLEAVRDLPEAGRGFAILAERCGACHAAFGGPGSFPAEPPLAGLGTSPRMLRHQWAAARLWEGLVAPSDEAWTSGAKVLAEASLESEFAPGKSAAPEIQLLAASVHDVGSKAVSAKTATMRVELYGQLLSTCANCHQRLGGGPGGARELR